MSAKQAEINQGLKSDDKKVAEKAKDDQKAFDESNQATLMKSKGNKDAEENLKNLSADQKKAVSGSFLNLGIAVLAQTAQLKTGQTILQSATGNMALVSRLPDLKSAIFDIGSNVKSGGEFLTVLPGLFKSAKISVTQPTESSKSVDVVNSGF